jgi:hypothetical protein
MAISARRSVISAAVVLVLSAGLTGCAQQQAVQATAKQPTSSGPDFSRDNDANFAATQMAQGLLLDLPPMPGYAGLRIVSYGIEVDVVGEPSAAIRAAVDRDTQRYQGSVIPVRYRKVLNTEKELKALSDRISADREEWTRQGIELTTWGIAVSSNTVEIGLHTYTPDYRAALLARYGDRISVTPYDVRTSLD